MIDKLNPHYSFNNPASIHDEEALTALELAGRTASKVNEVVNSQNQLKTDTDNHLKQQDNTIEERLSKQDADIENIRTVTVPDDVSKEVQKQIENGTFDEQIDESLNHLNERVENLLGSVSSGSTTMDAEVIDARVDFNGNIHSSAGESIRSQYSELNEDIKNLGVYSRYKLALNNRFDGFLSNNTLIKSSGFACLLIPVVEGEKITIVSRIGSYYAQITNITENNTVVFTEDVTSSTAFVGKIEITILEGTKYLYLLTKYDNVERVQYISSDTPSFYYELPELLENITTNIENIDQFKRFEKALNNQQVGFLANDTLNLDPNYSYTLIPVVSDESITITNNSGVNSYYGQLSDFQLNKATFSDNSNSAIGFGGTVTVKVLNNTKWLYLLTKNDGTEITFTVSSSMSSLTHSLPEVVTELCKNTTKKRVSILGDSISSYGDYVTPETNRCYYNGESNVSNITQVNQMWWYKLFNHPEFTFEVNNSYSGSTICTTGYDGAHVPETSFIGRMKNIGRPDILFIFGGTNDSWASSPLGTNSTTDNYDEDVKKFRPACLRMLSYLKYHNPNCEIYFIINEGLSADVTSSITYLCDYYNIPYIQLTNIETDSAGHPTVNGMNRIYNQVINVIKE